MKWPLHVLLFVLTFLTTTVAGVQWLNLDPFELDNMVRGLPFSLCVCSIMLAHEMGHYLAAKRHGVVTTLPFFLPLPAFLVPGMLSFGTLGAVIRIRSHVASRRDLLDIGASGPIAGFVATVLILIAGYATLPPIDYLYSIHPTYAQLERLPREGLTFGLSPLLQALERMIPPRSAFIPPMNEIYHYPMLCAGWFGLFLTAMNLLPVGQLDGGHISKAVLGRRALWLERATIGFLLVLGLAGLAPEVGVALHFGWPGWLLWSAILIVMTRRFRTPQESLEDGAEIGSLRYGVALACLIVLVLTFSLTPFVLA